MIVANFTCDPIDWMHVGANGTIPAYDPDDPKRPHIVIFEDGRARFILNKFAIRGLVAMNFGDDEKEKKTEALNLWTRFWERQIEAHNQHNEDQKEKGNRYSRPTDELDRHAKLLGLELLRPWRVEAKGDNKQVDELRGENVALRKSLEAMQSQMTELMRMMAGGMANNVAGGQIKPQQQAEPKKEPDEPDEKPAERLESGAASEATTEDGDGLDKIIEANRNKYMRLGESNLSLWLNKNWDAVLEMPEENRLEIKEKYEKVYGESFPKSKT